MNTKPTTMVMYQGKVRLLAGLAVEFNIDARTLYSRIFKQGWPVEKALTEPVNVSKRWDKENRP